MANFELINNGAPTNPNSYTLKVNPPLCFAPTNQICYIIAADDGTGRPVIDTPLLGNMLTALNTRTDLPRIKLKP